MNLPKSPQLKANYILDLFPKLQVEAKELFTDTSVRLETRAELLEIFGRADWATTVSDYISHISPKSLIKALDIPDDKKELLEGLAINLLKYADDTHSNWERYASYDFEYVIESVTNYFLDEIDEEYSEEPLVVELTNEFKKQVIIGFLNEGVNVIEYDW